MAFGGIIMWRLAVVAVLLLLASLVVSVTAVVVVVYRYMKSKQER
jgi:hypothetical protein